MSVTKLIPFGPKNLRSLFPTVPWMDVAEYYLQIYDSSSNHLGTTNKTTIESSCDDTIRLHFLTSTGVVDAHNFQRVIVEHDPKSDKYTSPAVYPLDKSKHAVQRFNVKANNNYTVRNINFTEQEMPYVEELLDSPLVWMEWIGTQGQPDDYIPVVMQDKKFQLIKEDDRYTYELLIEFILSHEKRILRN